MDAHVTDAYQQMLSTTDDGIHPLAGQIEGGEGRHPEVAPSEHFTFERITQQPGGAVDGVALRHVALQSRVPVERRTTVSTAHDTRAHDRNRSPRGVARNPAAASASPRGVPSTKPPLTVSIASLSTRPRVIRPAESASGDIEHARVVTEREQALAAAFDVEGECAIHEHDESARFATGPVTGAGIFGGRRPRQCGTIRVGRIGRRQSDSIPRRLLGVVEGERTQPVDGGTGGELRSTERFDEVAATCPTGFLETAEHFVGEREPAGRAFVHDGPARDDTVAVEQGLGESVRSQGRILVGWRAAPTIVHRRWEARPV